MQSTTSGAFKDIVESRICTVLVFFFKTAEHMIKVEKIVIRNQKANTSMNGVTEDRPRFIDSDRIITGIDTEGGRSHQHRFHTNLGMANVPWGTFINVALLLLTKTFRKKKNNMEMKRFSKYMYVHVIQGKEAKRRQMNRQTGCNRGGRVDEDVEIRENEEEGVEAERMTH